MENDNNQPLQHENFLKKQFIELKKSYKSSVTSIFTISLNSGIYDDFYEKFLQGLLNDISKEDFKKESDFEPYEGVYSNMPSLKLIIFCDVEFPFKPPKVRLIDVARSNNKYEGFHPCIVEGEMSFPLIGEMWCVAITLKNIVDEVIKILNTGSEHYEKDRKKEYFSASIMYALESYRLHKKA